MIAEYFSAIFLLAGIFLGIALTFAGLACFLIYISKDK